MKFYVKAETFCNTTPLSYPYPLPNLKTYPNSIKIGIHTMNLSVLILINPV